MDADENRPGDYRKRSVSSWDCQKCRGAAGAPCGFCYRCERAFCFGCSYVKKCLECERKYCLDCFGPLENVCRVCLDLDLGLNVSPSAFAGTLPDVECSSCLLPSKSARMCVECLMSYRHQCFGHGDKFCKNCRFWKGEQKEYVCERCWNRQDLQDGTVYRLSIVFVPRMFW